MACRFGVFPRLKSSRIKTLLIAAFLFGLIIYSILSFPLNLNPMAFKRSPPPQTSSSRENRPIHHQNVTLQHLPHVIIIGVTKAGTYALLTMLSLHSRVAIAVNEVHFFDWESNHKKGFPWFVRQMPYSFPDQLTIVVSPTYFTTTYVPERILQWNPDIKLLLIVREPTDRVVSMYTQLLYNQIRSHKITMPIEDYLLKDGRPNLETNAVHKSLYYVYMQNWLRYFPLKSFHIVDGDELVKNPVPELKEVERFLGLEPEINSSFFVFNKEKQFYCLKEHGEEKCLSNEKGRPHPYVAPDILEKLHQFYHEPNNKFFKLVGRTFNWK